MTDSLSRYLDSIPSTMERGRVRLALERTQGFSGNYMPRHKWAETHAAVVRVDEGKGRVWSSDATFYEFGQLTLALVRYVVFLQRPAVQTIRAGTIAGHVICKIKGARSDDDLRERESCIQASIARRVGANEFETIRAAILDRAVIGGRA